MSSRKNKNRQPPEIHYPDDAELNRMSMSMLKVETMNWQTCDLGIEDSSDDEDKAEMELTGAWRFKLEGITDDFDICGHWELRPSVSEAESEDSEALYNNIADDFDFDEEEQEEGDEEEEEQEEEQEDDEFGDNTKVLPVLRPRRHRSAEALVESFSGGQMNRGKKSKPAPTLPPIKSKVDPEPLSGIEQPRFVWETQSDTSIGLKKREIAVVKFQDTAVLGSLTRVWRKTTKGGEGGLGIADDEEEDIEELLSLEVMEAIRPVFDAGALTLAKYTTAITKALKLPSKEYFPVSLTELFIKIDTFGVGKISWDDLCDFMQQKYAEKAETEYTSPPVALVVPCRPIETVHRTAITRTLMLPDRGLLTFSEDGIVSLWTSDFKARIWRALGRPASLKSQKIADKKANKWYTDIVLVQQLGKYVVPTGEKELQFYDTSTYDPYCQITNLYSVPIHIDAKATGSGLVVAMGDIQGNVMILVVKEAINTLRIWSQQRRVQNVPTISISDAVGLDKGVRYAKFKVHSDMISHLMYIPSIDRVVTSSMDQNKSLTMGKVSMTKNANEIMEDLSSGCIEGVSDIYQAPKERRSADEVKFLITNGCRTFDVWESERLIVAGGLDRVVWVWNLYVPSQPMAKMRGHNAAIFKVVFDQRSYSVFSFCTEKTIRIWALYNNSCIGMYDTKQSRLRGPGIYCFQPFDNAILIQTSVEASYITLKRSGDDSLQEGATHSNAITALMYNPQHNYIMSCSEEDILVWSCQTGKKVAEFNTIGGDGSMHLDTIQSKLEKTMEEESRFIMPMPLLHGREQVDTYDVGTVTCVALDNYGRRFFTAHSNGVIKAWNFYNGRNLYNLYKPQNNLDICDMHYITINDEHRYLVTVGWDRRVVIYIDSQTPAVLQFSGLPDEPIMFSHKELNHQDDVWAVSFGFPNLIASGDYSGRLLVWNINSGHIVANLRANQCRDSYAERNSFITALVFHDEKFRDKKTTYLIAAGPYHLLHIWRANTTRELNVGSVGWVRPCGTPRDFVTAMKCFKGNNNIITSDTYGCVTIWVIEDALGDTEPTEWFPKNMTRNGRNKLIYMPSGDGPELFHKDQGFGKGPVQLRVVRTWKAHVDAFAALEICETYGLIITGGRDCAVRVWDMEGRYIGVFGQNKNWLIGDKLTYAPSHPRDVMLDMKRVRALEIFRKEEKEVAEVELLAESRARGLVDRKKDQLLSDLQISEKARPYLALMSLTVPTDVWVQPNAPVGPHRRNRENPRAFHLEGISGNALYKTISRADKQVPPVMGMDNEEEEEEEDDFQ